MAAVEAWETGAGVEAGCSECRGRGEENDRELQVLQGNDEGEMPSNGSKGAAHDRVHGVFMGVLGKNAR